VGAARAPKFQKGMNKREAIIRVAAQLFSQKGFSATTLQDIAEEAGTKAGSLYYHFPSRDDIVREVLKTSMTSINEKVVSAWAALPEGASVIDHIKAGIEAHMRAIHSGDPYLPAYDRIINEVPQEMRDEFIHLPRLYGKMWRDLIRDGQLKSEIRGDLDSSVLRLFLLGSITWSHLWFDPKGHLDIEALSHQLTEMFLNGVGARKD
ncbi:MAG TPA: TetR/AcrR family transcriptional regulator, partial [Sphingobium sp.]|nr:TetR/AcrR family transcriptional regulator [Sphingobium sp.]